MEAVFLKLVNMSLTASWLVLAILLVRFVFRKAPKWIFVALWGLVALRLVCPFSMESALSLIPSSEPLPQEIIYSASPVIDTGITPIDNAVNPVLSEALAPAAGASANPTQIWSFVLANVWLMGLAAMLLYALASYVLLRRRMATATRLRDNIKQSEQVDSPFVLGLFRPTIYLPYTVAAADMVYIIAHEQAHIRRRDHWWKPFGFLLLSVYWFNPILWAAYVLLCRDIEAACDEKVIHEMEKDDRRAYSTALLNCSVHRRRIAACPLAFGEVGVKDRIKSVMNYKKPAFWFTIVSVIACAAVAVCFLTNPQKHPEDLPTVEQTYVAISSKGEEFDVGLTGCARDRLIDFWGEPDGTRSDPWADIWELEGLADVIVYYDQGGNIEYIKVETVENSTISEQNPPVTWTYSPMMSATWHAAFHFSFEVNNEYIHIEASCDNGMLWNPNAGGQPKETPLRFEAGEPVCWIPDVDGSLTDTVGEAAVSFTVYDGGEMLYTGTFEITRTGADNGQSFYEARLVGTDLLTLRQESGNRGATVTLSDSAAIVAYSDLNHNRVNESIVVRTIAPGEIYELAVYENGEELWNAEAGLPHVGWNTIMLYSEGGQDYLVQYLPTMFQGRGSYTCTVFSLEGGRQTVKEEWSVEFEVEPGDPLNVEETPEMAQFAKEVGVLLRNSTVLLSTEQGIPVIRHAQASAMPQLYPVRFNPEEIQAAIDGVETAEKLTPDAVSFPDAPLELLFASGAGAWGTTLTLQPDGSFTGSYSDAEMGSNAPEYPHGTYYVCEFSGRFADIQQISDTAFSMRLDSLTTEQPEGTTWIEDNIRYIAAEPYGLTGGQDFILYAPGTSADELPAECRDWWPDAWLWRNGELEELTGWGLCSIGAGYGFFQQ